MLEKDLIELLNDDEFGFLKCFSEDEKSQLEGQVELPSSDELMSYKKYRSILDKIVYSDGEFYNLITSYLPEYMYCWAIDEDRDQLKVLEFKIRNSPDSEIYLLANQVFNSVQEEYKNIGIRPVIYISENSLRLKYQDTSRKGKIIEFGYAVNLLGEVRAIRWILIDRIQEDGQPAKLKLISKYILYYKTSVSNEFYAAHFSCTCGKSLTLINANDPFLDGKLYQCSSCGKLYLNPNDEEGKVVDIKKELGEKDANSSEILSLMTALNFLIIIGVPIIAIYIALIEYFFICG